MSKYSDFSISSFYHRVALASANDDSANGQLIVSKTGVITVWANIEPVRGAAYVNGIAIRENLDNYSHNIIIRFIQTLDISAYAWLYEERPSGRRWYKVLSVEEVGERQRFWKMQCRLQQKSVNAVAPKTSATYSLPVGAIL